MRPSLIMNLGPYLPSAPRRRIAIACLLSNALVCGTVAGEAPVDSPLTLPAGVPLSAVQIHYEFSTLAGVAGRAGWLDGQGSAARFLYPPAVAIDDEGAVYVADYSQVIRRVSPAGEVTTLAGRPGSMGNADGTGDAARFHFGVVNDLHYFGPTDDNPMAIAVDGEGSVFVADNGNGLVRKVTAQGVVSTIAQVQAPRGIAVDAGGAVYVTEGHSIKKINPQVGATVLAGTQGVRGARDGPGDRALFNHPQGLAVDLAGNVYVADSYNHTVRKIAPDGFVSTVAGNGMGWGAVDGTGSEAGFTGPAGVAIDRSGVLFVTDLYNHTIRQISPDGVVTTVAGKAGVWGSEDGIQGAVRFNYPVGIAVDAAGNLYVADSENHTIRKGTRVVRSAPSVIQGPRSQTAAAGDTVVFETSSFAAPAPTFQWLKDGVILPGATEPALVLSPLRVEDAGVYTAVVENGLGRAQSAGATLTVPNAPDMGRLINGSALAPVGWGEQRLSVGFAFADLDAQSPISILIRAVGPSLSAFGLQHFLEDPRIELFEQGVGAGKNDDWKGDDQIVRIAARVGAFPFTSASTQDAALYRTIRANGTYEAIVSATEGATGRTLAEVYTDSLNGGDRGARARLVNLSVRALTAGAADPLVFGFVIGGGTSRTLLIRALGPGLLTHGVTGFLPDPRMELFSGTRLIGRNEDWRLDSALAAKGSSGLALPPATHALDAAMLVTLPPGAHTVRVMDASRGGGVVVVELYEVPGR
jgi:hypothetical protein